MLDNKDQALNCLKPEQFALLCETHEEGDEFPCDCDECGNYFLGDNRCSCGNRRIAVYYNVERNYFYCEAY
jgi:hypothetical protein